MLDIILSTPVVYVYLVVVMALLIIGLWTREAGPPLGERRALVWTTGRGIADASVAARCNLDPGPFSVLPPRRGRRPFRDLQATLSASYAARLEQAIRTIRVGPPPGPGHPI
jgi:hypothetical protein